MTTFYLSFRHFLIYPPYTLAVSCLGTVIYPSLSVILSSKIMLISVQTEAVFKKMRTPFAKMAFVFSKIVPPFSDKEVLTDYDR